MEEMYSECERLHTNEATADSKPQLDTEFSNNSETKLSPCISGTEGLADLRGKSDDPVVPPGCLTNPDDEAVDNRVMESMVNKTDVSKTADELIEGVSTAGITIFTCRCRAKLHDKAPISRIQYKFVFWAGMWHHILL